MEEKTFLKQGGIEVTNSRFMVHGQTYAMSGVTSVKSFQKKPTRTGPIIVGVVGLLFMASSEAGIIVGMLVIASAVAWWFMQKPTFSVLLSSASGEVKAHTTEDNQFISNVVSALNEAIIYRG